MGAVVLDMVRSRKEGKGHDRPHLLDAQLTHWLVRLPPLPVLVVVETVSELSTESASMLFLPSADPEESEGELGTDGGVDIEGERDTSVNDMSDIEVVMAGGEEGTDGEEEEEEEEKEEEEGVVVG